MYAIEKVDPGQVRKVLKAGYRGFEDVARETERRIRRAVRHSNPTVAGVEETIDQPIYDSFSIAANTAFPKTVLFQSPIGQNGKTLAQTNLVVGGPVAVPATRWSSTAFPCGSPTTPR